MPSFRNSSSKRSALGVGPVENGEVAVLSVLGFLYFPYLVGYDSCFLLVAVGWPVDYFVALGLIAVHIFLYLPLVVFHQRVGGLNDALGAAVVALQFEEFGTGKFLLEVEDVVDIRPSERIDALIIVADDAHAVVLCRQLQYYGLLGDVCVLILVYENIAVVLSVFLSDIFVVAEENIGIEEQVVEVHSVRLSQMCLVRPVYRCYCRHTSLLIALYSRRVVGVVVGGDKVVLGHGDKVMDSRRLVFLVVETHAFDNILYQCAAVGLVVDGVVGVIAYAVRLYAQYS